MGNVVNEWVKDLKVGDTVWVIERWRPVASGREREVTAVGRIWITIAGQHRLRIETGYMEDSNYQVFRSEQAFKDHYQRGREWARLRQQIDQYPIGNVTVERIEKVREILGLKPINSPKGNSTA